MGSNNNLNFGKSFGNEAAGDGGGGGSGRPPGSGLGSGNFGLARQLSIYSLTFDEFQNTLSGMGKDFGSMNMDELLKNIWSAEETQCMTTGAGAAAATAAAAAAVVGSSGQDGGNNSGGYLQRQGSLTLPRTLSQKTVDEVWKDIAKEFNGGTKDGGGGAPNVAQNQRQQTLGEITLEEFLVRAGVVREDTQVPTKPNNANNNANANAVAVAAAAGMFADFARGSNNNNNNNNNNSNTGFGINFQQPGRGVELMGNRITDNNHQMTLQSANLPLNVNGVRTSQQQTTPTQMSQQQQQQHQQQQQLPQQQPLFPKQAAVSYASAMTLPGNAQLANTGLRGGIVGLADSGLNSNLVQSAGAQGGAGMGMVGLGGGGGMGVPSGSPAALSSDGLGRSNGDSSSVSPVPYMFNGGLRGRKGIHAVDKVVERRQRRMIKNRESAARSRARKQAYTMELEQEVQKLKEENQELRKKQAEIMEQQKNQVMEMMNNAQTGSRKKLRRTQTGPW